MSTEDRLRAATRARADLVRDVRPLELPDELPAGARLRRVRPTRRWLNWGAPLAAAAVVALVATLLVVFRQGPAAPPVPAASPSAAAVPRYFVQVVNLASRVSQKDANRPALSRLVAADDRTGKSVASFPSQAGEVFTGVTAAADDRTFVVSTYAAASKQTRWYLLRLAPGTSHPATLELLPISPLKAQISGLALSPDGKTLAVMFAAPVLTLRTYSVSSGPVLGTWQTTAGYWMSRTTGANAFELSWSADDRDVTFRFDAYARDSATHVLDLRRLDVTAGGHDLLSASKLLVEIPWSVPKPDDAIPCAGSVATPDGKTVVCGEWVLGPQDGGSGAECSSGPPTLIGYPTTPGPPPGLLFRYPGNCVNGSAWPLWSDDSGRTLIGLVSVAPTASGPVSTRVGVISAGTFSPLRAPVLSLPVSSVAGPIVAGAIAF